MKERDLDDMIERGIIFVPTLSLLDLFARGFEERWCENPHYHPPVNKSIKRAIQNFTETWNHTAEEDIVAGTFITIPKGDFRQAAANQIASLSKFVQKGGSVAMGTDCALGFSFHTTPIRELELLEKCGLSRLEVIKASTLTAAAVFDKENVIGSIEKGKAADLLLLHKNPLENLSNIKEIYKVIQSGKFIK